MRKSDQSDECQEAVPDDYMWIDYDKEFANLIREFIVKPFGRGTMNQDLVDLFS